MTIHRYCSFKETKKQKNNSSSVFVHLHLLSDEDFIATKITEPVAFLALFLYSLRFFWLGLWDLHASCQRCMVGTGLISLRSGPFIHILHCP